VSTLILASASPRRRELLARAGLVFDVVPADIDETPLPDEDPAKYVARISAAKAAAVAGDCVIAADTTVTIDGLILAKAESDAEASAMLARLSGRTHRVLTGYLVRGRGATSIANVVATEVDMIDFDPADYVASGEWRGKAGAYAIQGVGAALVREIRGSVTNVIGLPLVEILRDLALVGGPTASLARGAGV
jgi:septum formation protein